VDQFLTAMAIFIQYPWLAGAIGLVLGVLGRWRRRRTGIAVGMIWLLYAAYETAMRQRWLCSGECNIRVDLLLIYPVLLLATFAWLVSILRPRLR
jgi:hypothetical protein